MLIVWLKCLPLKIKIFTKCWEICLLKNNQLAKPQPFVWVHAAMNVLNFRFRRTKFCMLTALSNSGSSEWSKSSEKAFESEKSVLLFVKDNWWKLTHLASNKCHFFIPPPPPPFLKWRQIHTGMCRSGSHCCCPSPPSPLTAWLSSSLAGCC